MQCNFILDSLITPFWYFSFFNFSLKSMYLAMKTLPIVQANTPAKKNTQITLKYVMFNPAIYAS